MYDDETGYQKFIPATNQDHVDIATKRRTTPHPRTLLSSSHVHVADFTVAPRASSSAIVKRQWALVCAALYVKVDLK